MSDKPQESAAANPRPASGGSGGITTGRAGSAVTRPLHRAHPPPAPRSPVVAVPLPPAVHPERSGRGRGDMAEVTGTAVSAPSICWALSPLDYRAHVIAEDSVDGPGGLVVARCGHRMPQAAVDGELPRGPLCAACALMTGSAVNPRPPPPP